MQRVGGMLDVLKQRLAARVARAHQGREGAEAGAWDDERSGGVVGSEAEVCVKVNEAGMAGPSEWSRRLAARRLKTIRGL